jgi:hypothetical protein
MIYYLKVINECDTKCEYDKERSWVF